MNLHFPLRGAVALAGYLTDSWGLRFGGKERSGSPCIKPEVTFQQAAIILCTSFLRVATIKLAMPELILQQDPVC